MPLSFILAAGLAAETDEAAHSGHSSQLPWNWDPLILAGFALSLFLYTRGLSRINQAVRSRVVGPARCTAFIAGIASLFLVLITPFDALDDQ
ncbi:MAG: hypothetical protein M3Z35_00545, partial [Nitrospirota bacterium]|nr:hypothetical protein [Nitrospirota bacterium]